jgi:hypothetical protein
MAVRSYFIWIPAVLVAVNSVSVVLTNIVIQTSEDTESGMGWSCCFILDPAALLFRDPHTFNDPFVLLLLVGGLQWLLIGLGLAAILHWLTKGSS